MENVLPIPDMRAYLSDRVPGAMYKQGEGGEAEKRDLALPEGSTPKRRGVGVMMMMGLTTMGS